METVRFKRVFKYSTKGHDTVLAKPGDVADVSDEIAASVVKSGAGEVVDLEAEKSAHENEVSKAAEKAEAEKVDLTLGDEAPKGDGKKGSPEDKSAKPGDDKGKGKE